MTIMEPLHSISEIYFQSVNIYAEYCLRYFNDYYIFSF